MALSVPTGIAAAVAALVILGATFELMRRMTLNVPWPLTLLAPSVTGKSPLNVGMPEINPDAAEKVRPVGAMPAAL